MPELSTYPPLASNAARTGNRLLDSLDSAHLADLLSNSTMVSLDLAQIVHQPDQFFKYIYFPTDGVVSILYVMEDGQAAEVSAIGREGLVGSALTLGVDRTHGKAIVQIRGKAIRMEALQFTDAIERDEELHALLERYVQSLLEHVSQTVGCNRLHTLPQRFACRLLQMSDCMKSDSFTLTQKFISQMLMVRRAAVSAVASEMQKSELITYSRGKIKVLDRAGLEAASCECYLVVDQEYNRMLG